MAATSLIFAHRFPDFVPGNWGGVYCKISEGKDYYPQFKVWWDKCGGVTRRGIYQYPKITSDVSVADNVSFMLQHLANYAGGQSAVQDLPILIYCNANMNLTQIGSYLDYLYKEVLSFPDPPKPILYMQPSKWNQVNQGPNANSVSWNIAQMADVCSSDYQSVLPANIMPFGKPKMWEFASGKLQYDVYGEFLPNENPFIPVPVVVPVGAVTEIVVNLMFDGKPITGTIKLK